MDKVDLEALRGFTPEPQGVVNSLLHRAYEVVHHDADCPSIGGNGDADCRCDAVPFLRDFKKAIAALQQSHNHAVDLIAAERRRQVESEGWTPEHDDEHDTEEMAFAAACYVTAGEGEPPPAIWPWDWKWWKPKGRVRNLIRAGALIVAEIERLQRKVGSDEGGA